MFVPMFSHRAGPFNGWVPVWVAYHSLLPRGLLWWRSLSGVSLHFAFACVIILLHCAAATDWHASE